ncbi:DUF366 family protein [Methanolobus profundi]|uniref:DUF366 domain-containing protein n=1 Tax=Methanolobus profundi TaxID=487685 RepID=A0A1I4NKY5_9EURY|nr:DUF366 family protein [Methanolobus profundi]SFM16139.1 hypothetical protein SAMN04488696_0119 [Methanolobus profundi]
MECIILDNTTDYDGSQISSLWAYNLADVQSDSIIAFRGGCDVKIEHMIDLEDKKQGDMIFSTDMVHFIIEHFDSTDLKLVYARQRLFTAIVKEILSEYRSDILRKGDDLFVDDKKLTVSIASTSAVSQKIHFGINVVHDHYGSFEDLGLGSDDVPLVMEYIARLYYNEFIDIEKDLRKSRPLDVI